MADRDEIIDTTGKNADVARELLAQAGVEVGAGGDDNEDALTPEEQEAEDAMVAGYQAQTSGAEKVKLKPAGKKPEGEDEPEKPASLAAHRSRALDSEAIREAEERDDDGEDVDADAQAQAAADAKKAVTNDDDDDEAPVTLTRKEWREAQERMNRLDAVEKSTQTTAGHLGSLKSMIQQAGSGKPLTIEALPKVKELYGEEFAQSMVDDLNAAGFGKGSALDDVRVSEMVAARVEAAENKMHLNAVKRAHKDATDYFAGGKHRAAFEGWLKTQPEERQQRNATSWDSAVIIEDLDDFKASQEKAATRASQQKSRVSRAVVPTTGAAASNAAPAVIGDPMEEGWKRVNGNKPKTGVAARR